MAVTTKYDPTKPVTIHNPLPQDQWPIRKGRKVIALEQVYSNDITIKEITGKINWYNPATHQTMTVTKGNSFYNIDTGRRSETFLADRVFPDTKAGRLALQKLKAEMYTVMAESKRKESDRCLGQAAEFETKAEAIYGSFN